MHETIGHNSYTPPVCSEDALQIIDHLQSGSIRDKIYSDRMTLGMIRPRSEHSVSFTAGDKSTADILEEHIESLGVHAKFPLTLDETAVKSFYEDVVNRQLDKPPEVHFVMSSRWHEFQQLMTSGQSIVMLLESGDDSAVDSWRSQLGHWNIEASRDPLTLRGKFGIHNHNNLFHGSDSPEAAIRELHVIIDCLKRTQSQK